MTEEEDRLPAKNNLHVGADAFLQLFTRIASQDGHHIGITLSVGGSVVTGVIIGLPEYLDLRGRSMGEEDAGFSALAEPDSPEAEDPPEPLYIHLKNAHHFHGHAHIPTSPEGTLWRGKIASVDGFTIGLMQATPAP